MKQTRTPCLFLFQKNTCLQLNVIKDRDERNKIYIFGEVLSKFNNKSVLLDSEQKAYVYLIINVICRKYEVG